MILCHIGIMLKTQLIYYNSYNCFCEVLVLTVKYVDVIGDNVLLYKRARVEAINFLKNSGNKTFKKSFEEALGFFDGKVFYDDYMNDFSGDNNLKGLVYKNVDKGSLNVYVNNSLQRNDELFVLAHSVGLLFEREIVANQLSSYSFSIYGAVIESKDVHSFFANEFACYSLMEPSSFIVFLKDNGFFATAKHYGVSVPVVRYWYNRLIIDKPEEFYNGFCF